MAGRRTRGWTWTSCWAFRPWSHEVFVKEVVLGVSYWNIGLLDLFRPKVLLLFDSFWTWPLGWMAEAFSLEKVLMNVSQSLEEELQEVHGHGHGHESHGDGHECHECHGDHGEGHSHGHSHGHQRHDYRVSSVGILRDQEVQKEKLGAESALTGEAGRMRAFGALKQREMQRNSTGFLVLRVVTPLPRAFGSSRGWIASSPGSCRPRVRTCIAPRA